MICSYEDQCTIPPIGALAVPSAAHLFKHQSPCVQYYNKRSTKYDEHVKGLTSQTNAEQSAKDHTSYRHHTNPTATWTSRASTAFGGSPTKTASATLVACGLALRKSLALARAPRRFLVRLPSTTGFTTSTSTTTTLRNIIGLCSCRSRGGSELRN